MGLHRDNGGENGNYYITIGYIGVIIYFLGAWRYNNRVWWHIGVIVYFLGGLGVYVGVTYRDNGKANGNYYSTILYIYGGYSILTGGSGVSGEYGNMLELYIYRDDGKENGDYGGTIVRVYI